MSLLNFDRFTPPTKEQQLASLAERIKEMSKQTFRQLVDTQKRGIEMVWENRNFTPQEVIDALGADAVKVFQYHGALTTFINELIALDGANIDVKLPTNEFTVSNGKITVGTGPYTGS